MKTFCKILLFIFIILGVNFKVLAYQIGVFEVYDTSSPLFNPVYSGNTPVTVTKFKFKNVSAKEYPVIVFNKYSLIDDSVYAMVSDYLNNGGKIILITPNSQSDLKGFKKLAKLIGVNVEALIQLSANADVNWVEQTIHNNQLNKNSLISKVSLYSETNHLAVFGDIEKHESAISKNHNGVLFSWCWGVDGDKKFNEKSMQSVLNELVPLPKLNPNHTSSHIVSNTEVSNLGEDIAKLHSDRDYVKDYQDNILNYSHDISSPQQMLELSKINELWAIYYAKNNNSELYKKYLHAANDNISNSTKGVISPASADTKGIWFDRGTIVNIKSKAEMGRYFDKLKESGIDTVYFETVNAGYTIYPSKIGTQNPLSKGKDYLSWAIDEAHSRKMKLQAWVWVFAVGNDRHNKIISKAVEYPGPVLEKNLRWAMLGENGNLRPKNQPEFWIDPSNREAVSYLLALIDEITSKYNVDGIQLDYIRYPFQATDNLMGFNHNSAEQFACKTGEKIFNNYQTNLLWNKWKEDNINSFVRKVFVNSKRKKSSLKISAAIFSKPQEYRFNAIQQNYENWLANGYVDFLTPMSYSSSISALNTNINPLKNQTENGLIYPGIALKHVDYIELLKQTSLLRENGFPGVSLFAVAQLNDDIASFMKNSASNNTLDVAYNKTAAAKILLHDYKKSLVTLVNIQYDLSTTQKNDIEVLISYANASILKINNKQLSSAIVTLRELERKNDNFFKNFSSYNPQRKQNLKGYIKRAESLLKISAKHKDN